MPEGAAGPLCIDAGMCGIGSRAQTRAARAAVARRACPPPARMRVLPMCVMWKNMYIEKHIMHIIGIY